MSTLHLRIESPQREPFRYRCSEASVVLGRSSKADLVVADPYISRLQARLFRENGRWFIEDLGSRNPTLLNGRPLEGATLLAPGDVLQISETRVSVEPGEVWSEAPAEIEGTLYRPASALVTGQDAAALSPEAALRRQSERLRLVHDVHRALAGSLSLEELLELILDRAFAELRPEEGAIFLKDPAGELRRAASRRLQGTGGDFLYSRKLATEVTEKGLAALVLDAHTDERFAMSDSIVSAGVRSIIAAPLLDPEGCLGMIVLNSRVHQRRFGEEDVELLATLGSVAAMRIKHLALAEEAAQRRLLEKELALARQIQVGLLPSRLPDIPGYALFASNTASRAVSGDFYQVQQRADGRECVLMVADVSGKGMAASLLTASLEALATGPIEVGQPPEEICEKVSRRLHARTAPERYATGFLAVLTPASGRLVYTNAGHNPAILVDRAGEAELLTATGVPLGVLPCVAYERRELTLAPGQLLLVYTDGITEAASPSGEEYGLERLVALCQRLVDEPLSLLAAAIEQDLETFVKGEPFADDRTLLILRRE
jgi:serine phosphatase RsbU (regulator of sigma subunit)